MKVGQYFFKLLKPKKSEKVVIRFPKKTEISLKDRFENYKGKNLAKEFSWDDDKTQNE